MIPNARKFQKGVSGNPGGRHKDVENVRDLARSFTRDAMTALHDICTKGKTEPARVAASVAILERGWGKPLQQVEVKRTPFDELSPAELQAIAAALEAIPGDAVGPAGGHQGPAVQGKAGRVPTVQ